MGKYILVVKERDGRWLRATKKGKEFSTREEAEQRRKEVSGEATKKIGITGSV